MRAKTGLTLDDGMMIWKARDAYRAHTVLWALFYLPQLFLVLLTVSYLHRGQWAAAATQVGLIVAIHAARWVLCTGLPRAARWGWAHGRAGLRGLFLLALVVGLSGCMEYGYAMTSLVGLNCRPEALQGGKCVTTTAQGEKR